MAVSESCAKYRIVTVWLFMFSAIYAAWKRHYDIAAISLIIFGTSMLYWRKPSLGWRRNVDIAIVVLAFAYFLRKSFYSKNRDTLFLIMIGVIIAYSLARYLGSDGAMQHYATAAHCFMHVIGNTGIVIYCL